MDRRNLNKNHNYRRNNRRNDDSLKEEKKELTDELKEKFMKVKEPGSSHTVLDEANPNVPDKTVKSLIVCDSSY